MPQSYRRTLQVEINTIFSYLVYKTRLGEDFN